MLMEELKQITPSSETVEQETQHENGDGNVLEFLDSVNTYITSMDSLASALRQGFLELASARHSMGDSRINGALFDLKVHQAATTVQINQDHVGKNQLHFSLRKWGSLNNGKCSSAEAQCNDPKSPKGSTLSCQATSQSSESSEIATIDRSSPTIDGQVQKERSKSLSMFGTLVPPKLRSAQLLFETALETLIEAANMRSSILSTFDQIQKKELSVDKSRNENECN